MPWNDGLKYLKVPQWRAAFERADVIFGVDVTSGLEAFIREHEYCGELACAVESDRVWMTCTWRGAGAPGAVGARLPGGMRLIRLAVATFFALPSAG